MQKTQLTLASLFLLGVTGLSAATNKWETSAAAGLTLTRGNSETALGTASINSTRKWHPHEVLLGAQGTYGESTVERTIPATTTPPRPWISSTMIFPTSATALRSAL
jgi:hypothetical protein